MTRATIFEREDGTLIFRSESADIKNLREIGLAARGEIDLYDADMDRLNEFFYYVHMAVKKYEDELSPNMQEYVSRTVGAMIKADMSPKNWLEFKKGACIV